VFVFDCSSAHGEYSPSALQAQNMNIKFGGKQSWLHNSIIPFNDPHVPPPLCGQIQNFSYSPDQAAKQKGVHVILEEHGLWQHYSQEVYKSGLCPLELS
jgi:hypothetical protein